MFQGEIRTTLVHRQPPPQTMSDLDHTSETHAPINRELGYSEHNWCRAVASGTGITVLALHLSNQTPESLNLHEILNVIRESHPLLACKLHYASSSKTFTFRQCASGAGVFAGISFHDGPATLELLGSNKTPKLSPLHKILEHELNNKLWSDPISFPPDGIDVVFGGAYVLSEADRVLVLRVHSAVCDRPTAVSLLRELMEAVADGGTVGGKRLLKINGEGEMSVESLIQTGLKKKRMWAHGLDMLSYSFNSARLTNLEFQVRGLPTSSEMIKLQINPQITAKILTGCESRGIKLCGALSAAALLAAHSTRHPSDKGKKKYGVVTVTSTRQSLGTLLSDQHFGFYQAVILSNHTIKGTETLWELAATCYGDFARCKTNNKHLTDMADLNFLMAKTIDNPGLTPSSSHRTSLVSVFEETVYDFGEIERKIGALDYTGCASVHGIGPSIGIFDTIRNGELDCTVVYPAPLHSREQMEEIVEKMTEILMDGSKG